MITTTTPDAIASLVTEIFRAPEYDDISLTDPRFRWAVKRLYTKGDNVVTLRDLVEAARADMSLDNDQLHDALRHLRDFMRAQEELTLEAEMFDIVAPLLKRQDRDGERVRALLNRFGWAGGPATTLQQAADALGVTRERVRQIQGGIERQLLNHHVWTPVLDRAIAIVRRELPLSETDLGLRLHNAGLTESSTFSADGLLKAIELFRPDVSLDQVSRHGGTWLIDPSQDDQLSIVTDIRTIVQKSVSNQGILSIASARDQLLELPDYDEETCPRDRFRSVVDELDGYRVVQDTWIVHENVEVRNPLVNRLQKILSVAPTVSLDWAHYLLRREYRDRRELDIDRDALRAFVDDRPEFRIDGDIISAVTPEHPANALSDSEQVLRQYIVDNGGTASFGELEAVGRGADLQKITVAVTLRSSPIFYKAERNTYRTIGSHGGENMVGAPSPATIDVDDEAEAAIEQAHLPETDLVFEEVDTRELDAGEAPADAQAPAAGPPQTPAGEKIGEREQGRVRRIIKQMLKRDGLVDVDTVHRQYASQFLPVSRDVILAIAPTIPDVVVIENQLITSMPRNGRNPLASGLRKMLTWLKALPVDLAVTQFQRDTRTVSNLTPEMLKAYVQADDEFGIENDLIVWRQPDLVTNVLSNDERRIANLLRDLPEPIGLGTVHARLHIPRHHVEEFNALFLNSVMVEDVGKHRHRLIGTEFRDAIERQEVSESLEATASDDRDVNDNAAAVAAVAAQASEHRDPADRPAVATPEDPLEAGDLIDENRVDEADTAATLTPSTYGSTETTLTMLGDLIDQAREGQLRLPEIQRDYVWKSTQVRGLLDSLYRHYPIGSMLIWHTADAPVSRGIGSSGSDPNADTHSVSFLLDGQQRLTSLQRLLDHNQPDIRFNPFTEEFRAATATIRRNPHWIPVASVLTGGIVATLREHGLDRHPEVEALESRLERLKGILAQRIPVNHLQNFDYEAVTDIFVRVNSQGTRLRTAELAVANLAFQLPGIVTRDLAGLQERLSETGWEIDTQVLLRMLNAVVTGQASFRRLSTADADAIEAGWPRLEAGVARALDVIAARLGIKSVDWLPTITALVVPVAYFADPKSGDADIPALVNWFVRASAFGRYTGQTETRLNQDLRSLADRDRAFRIMTNMLRGTVGSFRITQNDLQRATWISPLSLLFWLALRHAGAVDLLTGTPITSTRLPDGREVIRHQLLTRRAVGTSLPATQLNELSNLFLLTEEPSAALQQATLEELLSEIPVSRLESQLVPTDPDLWRPANARRFVEQRRRLLVRAMNDALQSLGG